jgi:hypothetical protein
MRKAGQLVVAAGLLTLIASGVVFGQSKALPGTYSIGVSGESFTASGDSSDRSFIMSTNDKLCLNGTMCTVTLKFDTAVGAFQGAPFNATSFSSAGGYASSIASGSNGFSCATNGCRFDLGSGANDYFVSTGTNIQTPGDIVASVVNAQISGGSTAAEMYGSPTDGATAAGVRLRSLTNLATQGAAIARFFNNNTTEKAYVDFQGNTWQAAATLPTCVTGLVGLQAMDGAASGASERSRLCLCTHDGSGSAAGDFDWVNLASGTVGTETTCSP